jgi:hypothetical protein
LSQAQNFLPNATPLHGLTVQIQNLSESGIHYDLGTTEVLAGADGASLEEMEHNQF